MYGTTTAGVANPVRVTIWEADGSPWHGAGYGCELRRRLRARGFSVRAVSLQQRRPTDDELSSEVHILSGGTTAATTSTGWVRATRAPLQEVLESALAGTATVVGICFGAQLLAVSLAGAGAVRPARHGMEVGLHRVRCTASSESHVVSQFHHHEVSPEAIRGIGATVTFENDHSHVQGFAVGSGVLGFQFHPELDPWRAASTVRANRRVIRSVGSCPRQAMRTIRAQRSQWHPSSFDRLVVDNLESQQARQPSLAA
ncbi:MAG: glutamine amidotransferase-related protein [Microthrixaceae bacterium]